jgi:hypothetical protein
VPFACAAGAAAAIGQAAVPDHVTRHPVASAVSEEVQYAEQVPATLSVRALGLKREKFSNNTTISEYDGRYQSVTAVPPVGVFE